MTYAVVHREWVWKQPWSSIFVLERSRRSGWHTSWKHTVKPKEKRFFTKVFSLITLFYRFLWEILLNKVIQISIFEENLFVLVCHSLAPEGKLINKESQKKSSRYFLDYIFLQHLLGNWLNKKWFRIGTERTFAKNVFTWIFM